MAVARTSERRMLGRAVEVEVAVVGALTVAVMTFSSG
jgi:hypothetical protein